MSFYRYFNVFLLLLLKEKGAYENSVVCFYFYNFWDIWIIVTKFTWNLFQRIPPQRVLTHTNSNNEMTNVRTTGLAQEREDPKIIYSNMYILEHYRKLWEFVCRFLHHKMMVAESFHLASVWQRQIINIWNTGVKILCQIYYKYDTFPIKCCLKRNN